MMNSEHEEDVSEDEFNRVTAQNNALNTSVKNNEQRNSQNVNIFASEEDENPPEFFESDLEDFGSTVSLASSNLNSIEGNLPKDKPSSIRQSRLDPQVYRKHRERNISLRYNLAEKLVKPVVANSIKKIDKLSQNVSNYQVNMQDALFQSRIASSNLLKLQQQLDKFLEAGHLKELKIDDIIENENSRVGEESTEQQNTSSLVIDIQDNCQSPLTSWKNETLPVPL